ncbi:bifunctional 2-polyprenyl-6-hydroxyphenol methylase/3-demethylubiquinol 3-O-methyltransferase UbiG [Ulvibacterium sp.]|uniref:class I SAM-dependent methyltransferase n=1 Tax=Ulvibacterium sp. TaxID=2665914 RepID=UPI0026237E64|nr:class I SAM-dependent methyltransferase [Ulvibacterium sp.]
MEDIFGKALLDFQIGRYTEDIVTYSSLNIKDTLPLPYLFRDYDNMPVLEQKALDLCFGEVLDIGCGTGSHSLYLQQQGFEVTALDYSKGAVETCKSRGVKKTAYSDILDHTQKYDTLLLLMNGIGIIGRLQNLDIFFMHLKSLLKPYGQILLDSSDIIYMYDADEDGGIWLPKSSSYYGEIQFTLEYKGKRGLPFYWLYLDYATLKKAAKIHGMICELVSNGEHYDYLAKLSVL